MYKAAIIGFGGMGKWHYNAISQQINGLEVTKSMITWREEALPLPPCLTEPEEIFADAEIDVVLVVTPNDSHRLYLKVFGS